MAPSTRNVFLLLLSVAAGCVDAVAFLGAGVFPANMTGNSVLLAISLLHPVAGGALLSALALLGFALGAAGGARVVKSDAHAWSPHVSLALGFAGLLVIACAAAMPFVPPRLVWMLVLAASAAMGLQSAAVQQIGVAGVATVFVTGTLTAAVTRLAANGPAARSENSPALPALSWLCYFGGAFLGSLHEALGTPIPVALPGLILLAVALAAFAQARRH